MVDLEALENSPAYAGVHHREIAAELRELRALRARVEAAPVGYMTKNDFDDYWVVYEEQHDSRHLRVRLVVEEG